MTSGSSLSTDVSTGGRRRADPRLPGYLVAGFGALVVALTTGQSELAALGAPFLVLAALGVVDRRPARIWAEINLHADCVIEGDRITGEVEVEWEGDADVTVLLTGLRGATPVHPSPVSWSLSGRGPYTLPFQLEAQSWGVHDIGTLWIRLRRRGGMLVWEQKLSSAPTLRVLPTPLRLNRLLKPAEPRAVAGMHLSRFRGQGTDFAELRPYQPGDRLRDLSWSTSARLGTPWVAVRHSEKTGTVLLLLDAVFSDERETNNALARAARVAWAIAQAHLSAQDRVGLLARGRTTAWLPPRGGRRARWLLLDELLAIGAAAEDPLQRPRRRGRVWIPADALIVGVTDLRSEAFARELLHYRRAGHTAVALVIETSDLLPQPRNPADAAAHRIWLAQRDSERYALTRGGVPSAMITGTEGVAAAISSLRRSMSAMQVSRSAATAR